MTQPCVKAEQIERMQKSIDEAAGLAVGKESRMARIEQKQEDMSKDLAEVKEMIKNFIEKADDRYAPKWVATFVWTVIIILTSGLLGGAVATLFK